MGKKKCIGHKYHRVDFIGQKIFACALPDCSHYMPKHMEPMIVGKRSLCWQCDKPFVIGYEHLEQDKPICANCAMGLPTDKDELAELIALAAKIKS